MSLLCLIRHAYAVINVAVSPNINRPIINYRCTRCGKETRKSTS